MGWRDWTGVGERRWKKAADEEVQPGKTLWDWLQLLIVPAILIGVTFAWSATQTRSDNKREDRRIEADRAAAKEARQDATLQTYLDQMSGLMLREKLLTSKDGEPGQGGRAHRHPRHASPFGRAAERRSRALPARGRGLSHESPHIAARRQLHPIEQPNPGPISMAPTSGASTSGAPTSRARISATPTSGAPTSGRRPRVHRPVASQPQGRRPRESQPLLRPPLRRQSQRRRPRGADLRAANLGFTDLRGVDFRGADLRAPPTLQPTPTSRAPTSRAPYSRAPTANSAVGLDLDKFIAALSPEQKKAFLDSQKTILDSLSQAGLAKFNLTPEKLAKFRREASGG